MDEDSVVVRPIEPAEYRIAGDLVVEAYRTLGDDGDELYEEQLRDVAGRAASSHVLVAEAKGQVLGCVTVAVRQGPLSEVEDPESATIRMLGVASEARGRGVGEALVRAGIEDALRAGCRRVRLDTRTSMTAAQRLYERLGFTRDPQHDWSPAPGILLVAYVLDLDSARSDTAGGR